MYHSDFRGNRKLEWDYELSNGELSLNYLSGYFFSSLFSLSLFFSLFSLSFLLSFLLSLLFSLLSSVLFSPLPNFGAIENWSGIMNCLMASFLLIICLVISFLLSFFSLSLFPSLSPLFSFLL